ncbi:hypothetical protein [Bacillus sp. B15-48]|uniref:YqgU-like beta propeller domain-containing protein n=1 Tax=Bacillus sp. B15-48 TaxID=1548601 RepID=UPI00193F4060|nr:hypothetical protein [Bacillus sp. B15-48]MBM4762286.1 hypothetical protein [Bacillus sp. B15-48]
MKGWLNCYIGNSKNFVIFILLIAIIILSGCIKEKTSHPQPSLNHDFQYDKETPGAKEIFPITNMQGVFSEVSGWIDNERILYVMNRSEGSFIHMYHLSTGESELLYESEYPIVNTMISPTKDQVLIHSSPSSYVGEIKIISIDGVLLYETRVDSFELEFSWNQENENEILVTAFYEDWTFSSFILNSKEQNIIEIELSQPFILWPVEDDILYLNWDTSDLTLHAALVKESITYGEKQEIVSSAHFIDSSRDFIIAVQTNIREPENAMYTIFNKEFEQVSLFKVNQLSQFSGWLVPYFDLIDSKQIILQFRPQSSGDADLYMNGFRLIEFSLMDGQEEVVFSDLENAPISCSPNGGLCLYGYQFEKLIDVKQKNIIDLIENK